MSNISTSEITFIITTFKSEKFIYGCLDSLPLNSKKIVVENSSNFKLKNSLETKYQNLECYIMKTNLGYGSANNFGINKSSTRYIFIINPDAYLKSDTLSYMFKALENKKFAIAAPYSKDDFNESYFENQKLIPQKSVKGFAMLIDKTQMEDVGYFDENFFIYLEEIDLCKRALKREKNIFLINTQIIHLSGISHGDRNDIEMEKSRNWHWMWSKFYYNKKHYGYLKGILATIPNLLNSFLKVMFYLIVFNKKKIIINLMRLRGLIYSYLLMKSSYRPYE